MAAGVSAASAEKLTLCGFVSSGVLVDDGTHMPVRESTSARRSSHLAVDVWSLPLLVKETLPGRSRCLPCR
jgi:hypothetical protein